MANWVSQRSCFLGIELAATRSTSFCGLAKSCDSYQWHEMSDRKINILLSSKVTRALKMSWLRGLAPAVIYLDMKSARMNTIGLTVSRTQEISGTFFFSSPVDELQPFLTSVRRTFLNVNEAERRAAKRTSLCLNLILTRFDVSLQNQFLSVPVFLPPERTLNKLLSIHDLFLFSPVNGTEICTGQTPAEPLWLLPSYVDSDYWCKMLQCYFQFCTLLI